MTVAPTVARRARYKLLGSILTTYGYAILGVAAIQPLLSVTPRLTAIQIVGTVVGLAAQGYALYIAPHGAPS